VTEPQSPPLAAPGDAEVHRSTVGAIEARLGWCVEVAAAALVAAEIVILLSGVVARYVFNRPLVWSDELASMLFLWLAMLGAVIAFRRDEHMRMTACVGMLPAPTRTAFDAFATGAALAFLLLIV
jgi:TRAP-type C4-dicarboxylate transport system permease small subunit